MIASHRLHRSTSAGCNPAGRHVVAAGWLGALGLLVTVAFVGLAFYVATGASPFDEVYFSGGSGSG